MMDQNESAAMASQEELDFIVETMPKGMISMIVKRTGKSRGRVMYHLKQRGVVDQDTEIIEAAREILYAVTRKRYKAREKNQHPLT